MVLKNQIAIVLITTSKNAKEHVNLENIVTYNVKFNSYKNVFPHRKTLVFLFIIRPKTNHIL